MALHHLHGEGQGARLAAEDGDDHPPVGAGLSHIGIAGFVDTLGAVLAPLYGIVVADYYLVRKQKLNVQDLFSAEPGSTYYFDKGWNKRALVAFSVASLFSVASVWTPALAAWAGFSWMFGALLGAVLHLALMSRKAPVVAVQAI